MFVETHAVFAHINCTQRVSPSFRAVVFEELRFCPSKGLVFGRQETILISVLWASCVTTAESLALYDLGLLLV